MLLKFSSFADLNPDQLMKIYVESNTENAHYFFPDEPDLNQSVRLCEKRFTEYLKDDFYTQAGRTYWVLEEDHQWISALRTALIHDGLFYIEALETKPAYRKQGYAEKLLLMVMEAFQVQGSFELCDCVSKRNIASIKTHLKAGFSIVSDAGFDYLQNVRDDQVYGMSYKFQKHAV